MMDNIDIFITAFKPFKEYINNDIFKVIGVNDFNYNGKLKSYKDNVGDNISNMNGFFNELTAFYWIAKNYPLKKYIGICSYRRYFDFFNDVPNVDELFETYDIILPKKESVGINVSVFEHYNQFHNINDLILINKILNEKYPQYKKIANEVINGNFLYCNNMFIMKREDFLNYCEFLFNILFDYLNFYNFKNYNDILNHVYNNKNSYLKEEVLTNSISYQSRIGGFLAERLFTIFIKYNFNNIYEIPMIFTPNIQSEEENGINDHFDIIDNMFLSRKENEKTNISSINLIKNKC